MRSAWMISGPILLTLSLFASAGARAELGGAASAVPGEAGRMRAAVNSQTMGNYTRHELTRANGGIIREFANADGKIFAVTWAGPGKPDLRSLMGPYFTMLQRPNNGIGRTMHALRRPTEVAQPDIKIQTAGHMGWFRGVALIPSLAPPGFSTGALSPHS